MVSCKTIVANLSEYLDGDASPEMRQKIENICAVATVARRCTTARERCW